MKVLFFGLLVVVLVAFLPVGSVAQDETPFPLLVKERLEPEQVFVFGSELLPQTATLEIALWHPPGPLRPLDVVLILDTSLSSQLAEVQALGLEVLSHLQDVDRVALITTGGKAELLLGFTNEFPAARENVLDLWPKGGNRLREALGLALEELVFHGRPDAQKAIVLSGNGLDASAATAPLLAQAEEARLQRIAIFPVVTASYADWQTLSQLARVTGGTFYTSFGARTVISLFRRWGREVIPPQAVTITLSLPPYILYLGAMENPPDEVRTGGALSTTMLRFLLPALPAAAGQIWRTKILLASTQAGRVEVFSPKWRSRIGLFVEGALGPVWQEQILPMPRLTVRTPPVARFRVIPQIPLVGEDVRFEDLSFDPDGEIVSWTWYFGDGTTSQERNPLHRYEAPGRYGVLLVVADRDGASAVAFQEITVRESLVPPPPTPEEICARAVQALLLRELRLSALAGSDVQERLLRLSELLFSVTRWEPETIHQAYLGLLELLEALDLPGERRVSLALAAVFHIVQAWPELRASCR